MIKLVVLMRRKAGLSQADFIARYETGHAPFARTHVRNAVRYERRYLTPLAAPGAEGSDDFDVLTELWYADRDAMHADLRHMGSPDVAAAIGADEEDLFDRSSRRAYVVVEEAGGSGAP